MDGVAYAYNVFSPLARVGEDAFLRVVASLLGFTVKGEQKFRSDDSIRHRAASWPHEILSLDLCPIS